MQQDTIPATRMTALRVIDASKLYPRATASHGGDSQLMHASHSTSKPILSTSNPSDDDTQQRVEHYQHLHRTLDKEFREYNHDALAISQDRQHRPFLLQRHLDRVKDEIKR